MAAPDFVQENGTTNVWESLSIGTSATNLAAFGVNVTAGATVIVLLAKTSTAVRTYSVSDDGFTTTYSSTTISSTAAGRGVQVFYKVGHAGGAVTLACRHAIGTNQTALLKALEIEASLFDKASIYTGAIGDVATNGGYAMGASGEINTTYGDVFVIGALVTDGTSAFSGATSGYTELAESAGSAFSQFIASTAALVNDRAIVAEAGTDRAHAGVLAAFYAPASGVTGDIAATTRRNTAALAGSVTGAVGAFATTSRRNTADIQGTVHPFPSGTLAADTRRAYMDFVGAVTGALGPFAATTRRNAMVFRETVAENARRRILRLRNFLRVGR